VLACVLHRKLQQHYTALSVSLFTCSPVTRFYTNKCCLAVRFNDAATGSTSESRHRCCWHLLSGMLFDLCHLTIAGAQQGTSQPLTHRYAKLLKLRIPLTRSLATGVSAQSLSHRLCTASERSVIVCDWRELQAVQAASSPHCNALTTVSRCYVALTASTLLSVVLCCFTAACATAGGQEQADKLMVCQESDGLHDRVPWHCDSDSCAAAVLQH
jgi:hypothetical protein